MREHAEQPLPAGTLTISDLADRVSAALRQIPSGTWIVGEILMPKRRATGRNTYFELVERPNPNAQPTAKIQIMIRAREAARIEHALTRAGLTLQDGLEVRIRGTLQHWAPTGNISFAADTIDTEWTLGRLALDKDALLRQLDAEGLLSRQQQLALAAMPLRVVLVTSKDSAAFADFTRHLETSGINFQICYIDSRVQGEGAPAELAEAITRGGTQLYASWTPDIICVIRGGGSRGDLATFDTEPVARAIATSPVPVLCAVGHEIDASIADTVAHASAKTPTAAAAFLIDRARVTHARAENLYQRGANTASRHLDLTAQHLNHQQQTIADRADTWLSRHAEELEERQRHITREAQRTLASATDHLNSLEPRTVSGADAVLRDANHTLDKHAVAIRAYDPQNVLARGYTITRGPDGSTLTASSTPPGTELTTQFADGTLTSTVTTPTGEPHD